MRNDYKIGRILIANVDSTNNFEHFVAYFTETLVRKSLKWFRISISIRITLKPRYMHQLHYVNRNKVAI